MMVGESSLPGYNLILCEALRYKTVWKVLWGWASVSLSHVIHRVRKTWLLCREIAKMDLWLLWSNLDTYHWCYSLVGSSAICHSDSKLDSLITRKHLLKARTERRPCQQWEAKPHSCHHDSPVTSSIILCCICYHVFHNKSKNSHNDGIIHYLL